MSDTTHDLTRSGLNVMAAEVGTEAGPGAITKEFNRALIDAFRANRGVVPGELERSRHERPPAEAAPSVGSRNVT